MIENRPWICREIWKGYAGTTLERPSAPVPSSWRAVCTIAFGKQKALFDQYQRYKNIVCFTNVPTDGSPVSLPHGLCYYGAPVVPDMVVASSNHFEVTADAVNVTVKSMALTGMRRPETALQVLVERYSAPWR